MRDRFRCYFGVLRARLKSVAHFRANVIAWTLYSPIQLAIVFLLWRIIYSGTDRVGGFAFRDMILYYLVVHFLRRVVEPVQTVNYEVWNDINQGTLDVYLTRPISFGPFVFFRSLGAPLVEIVIGLPFFVLFSFALGLPFPRDPLVVAAFLVSVLAGFTILFLIQFLIGTLTFWFERIFGIRDMIFSVFMLFSGQLIPISVLPKPLAALSSWLPFEGIYYVPGTIYAHGVLGPDVTLHLARQFVWIGVLTLCASMAWSRGITRYASQGG
ncbi:MAG TPA: ABC-2 family transporter protein [Thermoanaerobaculia bacterium]